MQLKSTCGPRAMLSRFTLKCPKLYASNWFNFLVVCLSGQNKSGKYYSKKHRKLMQLWKERTVIALRFYLIMGELQLLQTSVNILYLFLDIRPL